MAGTIVPVSELVGFRVDEVDPSPKQEACDGRVAHEVEARVEGSVLSVPGLGWLEEDSHVDRREFEL